MADPRYEEMMSRQAAAMGGMDPMLAGGDPGMGMDPSMMGEDMGLEEAEDAGRGGDAIMAHLTPGELVIPEQLAQDPEFQAMIRPMFEENGVNMEQYTVGDPSNSINPETGHPEFSWLSKGVRKLTGQDRAERKAKEFQSENARLMRDNQKFQKAMYAKSLKDMKLMQAETESKMQAERVKQNLLMQERQRVAQRSSILRQRAIKASGISAKAMLAVKASGDLTGTADDVGTLGGSFGRRLSRIKTAPRGGMGSRGGGQGKRPK